MSRPAGTAGAADSTDQARPAVTTMTASRKIITAGCWDGLTFAETWMITLALTVTHGMKTPMKAARQPP
ncbi:hypothetical protein NCCNTM_06640 [Mycolicibacterium sp. NCC-Tsukiji]|nr:hypothetical protein NCCNTM_06640 [Mycolicibacterium sp. NCC-Tsukiji]